MFFVPKLRRAFGVLVILIGALFVSGFDWFMGSAEPETVNESKTIFKEVISKYEKKHEEVSKEVKNGRRTLISFKEAVKKAKNKNSEFKKVHDEWNRVEKDVKELHNIFEKLVKTADKFYVKLREKANKIKSKDLRKESFKDIKDSKNRYIEKLKKAKSSINKVDEKVQDVQDNINYLEIRFSIGELENRLDKTFQKIDKMVNDLLPKLKKVGKESRKIIKGSEIK